MSDSTDVRNRALLTLDQIAKHLSVSRKTIYYWVGRAEIPFVRVGRHLRFDLEDVLKHFTAKTETQDPVLACKRAKAALDLRPRAWSLKTGADLAGS